MQSSSLKAINHSTVILESGGKAFDRLQSVVVSHFVNKISSARIVLFVPEKNGNDRDEETIEQLIPGNDIIIKAGSDGVNESILFSGKIIRHSMKALRNRALSLCLECRSIAFFMSVGRNSRYFYDQTDGEIIEEILQGYPDIELNLSQSSNSFSYPQMVQYHSSDWDFILTRSEVSNRLVFNFNQELNISPVGAEQDPVADLILGDNLFDLEIGLNADDQYQTIEARSWDLFDKNGNTFEKVEGEVATGFSGESSGHHSFTTTERFEVYHPGRVAGSELQNWADSIAVRNKLDLLKGYATMRGHAGIKPGNWVNLVNCGKQFDGKVFVSGIRHVFKLGLWDTELRLGLSNEWFIERTPSVSAPPASGLLPSVSGLQVGIVTQLEGDPKEDGRVLVRVPFISTEADGIWMRLAAIDAGSERGVVFRPEIGDEVVIGFVNDDPRDAIVIGSLFSADRPAPIAPSDENPTKGIVTRQGLSLLFDDEGKKIQIETPGGIKLLLDDENGVLVVEDSNDNSLELSSSGVSLTSNGTIEFTTSGDIKFNATNISLAANAQLSAEGSAGLNINSSGITEIKGSLVKIN